MAASLQDIPSAFTELRQKSKAHHRDIAETLGISEGELIAAHTGLAPKDSQAILHATRLRPHWPEIITSLETLGEVMALTRNASCVHEKTGPYQTSRQEDASGTIIGAIINDTFRLHLFYPLWTHAFGVIEQTAQGLQKSLQIFDANGTALHKVFLNARSNQGTYTDLIADFAEKRQEPGLPCPEAVPSPDTASSTETGQEEDSTASGHKIRLDLCQTLFSTAADQGIPLTITVGNPGVTQTHFGIIEKVVLSGPWLNILDPGFNLHLRQDHITNARFTKPTAVLDLLNAKGEIIVSISDSPRPETSDRTRWHTLLLTTLHQDSRPCL